MYLYFDKKGVLLEIVNDEALRQYNHQVNTMYVYIENVPTTELPQGLLKLQYWFERPNGETTEVYDTLSHPGDVIVTETVPFDIKRDVRKFRYGTRYKMFKIEMPSGRIIGQDESGNPVYEYNIFEDDGPVSLTIKAIFVEGAKELTLGKVVFTIEKEVVIPTDSVSVSQYEYILRAIDALTFTVGKVTTETLDPTSEASVTVTQDKSSTELKNYPVDFEFGIPRGATFTPAVAENGDISWTNDGGLDNPQTVNIKGPIGITPDISIDATVDANVGVPEVKVTRLGTAEAPSFRLSFRNLRGKDAEIPSSLNADYFASTTDTASGTNKLVLTLADSGVTASTYQGLTVDAKGRVTAAEDKGYAVKANVDTELAKKLDKAGGSVTGNLTIGGNLTVNGTTTSIDSTTLKVSDKLIEVAKDNTVKLTTPAGIVVPNYDGRKYGALVIDGDGNAQVGDVELDASGNIDVTNSDLQILATRDGLTDGNLVKWDNTKKTLVPDTTVASNASSALSKANANATEIANIKNGTNGTKVKYAEHADAADSATSAGTATKATEAMNVTENIKGHAIADIFESDGTTAKKATSAGTADKVANMIKIGAATPDNPTTFTWSSFNGSSGLSVGFQQGDFLGEDGGNDYGIYKRYIHLSPTGVTAGEYTAIKVDEKGRATAGGKAFAFIEAGAAIPEDVMIGGIVFEAKA